MSLLNFAGHGEMINNCVHTTSIFRVFASGAPLGTNSKKCQSTIMLHYDIYFDNMKV